MVYDYKLHLVIRTPRACPWEQSVRVQKIHSFRWKKQKGACVGKKKLYLIIQSALCVVIALMLAAFSIGIYREGLAMKAVDPLSWIYTREKVASAAFPAILLLGIGVILTLFGLIKGIRDENADKPAVDMEWMRDQVVSRVSVPSDQMKEERTKQKKLFYGGWAAFGLTMVPALLYIINGAHFPNGDLEPVFIALVIHIAPWTVLGLVLLGISSYLRNLSMEREIQAAKEQAKLEKDKGIKLEAQKIKKQETGKIRLLRIALLVLAALMIVTGVINGSAWDVFGKAVKICTECVGLG